MRSTRNPVQALERLAEAVGAVVTRDGKQFVVDALQTEGYPTVARASARALANLAWHVRAGCGDDAECWHDYKQAVRYDPGLRRLREGSRIWYEVDVPTKGLSAWEEAELTRLAITEIPG